MELLLALPAGQPIPQASAPLIPVHMTCRLSEGFHLLCSTCPVQGGLMLVDDTLCGEGDPLPCCERLVALCQTRCHRGIVCDFDHPMETLLIPLHKACAEAGLSLFVPEHSAGFAPGANILIPTSLVSGSLEQVLQAAIQRYGAECVVPAIQWQREDLTLPANGRGQTLTPSALSEQLHALQPATFFDRGLCAHYYTYMAPGGQAHFVVFDTPQSIRSKLLLAQRLGLSAVLMAQPEVGADLNTILEF